MIEITIPAIGWGMGHREYGESLTHAVDEIKPGVEYKAVLVKASPPDDWDEESKEDFPSDAYHIVLTPLRIGDFIEDWNTCEMCEEVDCSRPNCGPCGSCEMFENICDDCGWGEDCCCPC